MLTEARDRVLAALREGRPCIVRIGISVHLERTYGFGLALKDLPLPYDPVMRRDFESPADAIYVFPIAGRAVIAGCDLPPLIHSN